MDLVEITAFILDSVHPKNCKYSCGAVKQRCVGGPNTLTQAFPLVPPPEAFPSRDSQAALFADEPRANDNPLDSDQAMLPRCTGRNIRRR